MDARAVLRNNVIRILALHGSEGCAEEFSNHLEDLKEALVNGKETPMRISVTTVEGPFLKGRGYSWWTMPPGVRSFNAREYEGFEESTKKVLDVWKRNEFDLVLGHSQGAILIASILALNLAPYHPKRGYLFNGVSFPNPFAEQIESMKIDKMESPRILFVFGRKDTITPNSSGETLREGLANGNYRVHSCYHDGGHGIPQNNDPESLSKIVDWIYSQQ